MDCSAQPHSVCVDSYYDEPACVCIAGYQRIDGVCTDVNECRSVSCGSHGNCINKPGYYKCECEDGFKRSNGECISKLVRNCLQEVILADLFENI